MCNYYFLIHKLVHRVIHSSWGQYKRISRRHDLVLWGLAGVMVAMVCWGFRLSIEDGLLDMSPSLGSLKR